MLHIEYGDFDTEPVRFGMEQVTSVYRSFIGKPNLNIRLCMDRSIKKQGYSLLREESGFLLKAGSDPGALYGLLDLGTALKHCQGKWEEIAEQNREPYLENRGIKFNIPLDVRTPSYSDGSDSAFENIGEVWEKSFWIEFLDEMAKQKYNVLSLWSLSPFPSLVKIPEYPEASLADVYASVVFPKPSMNGAGMYTMDMKKGEFRVKRISIEDKIEFFRWVMAYAKIRCIEIYLFTWNLFVFGTEESPYGITCDQNNPVTKDYLYRAVKACLSIYPLLAGIGVTAGENMVGDESDIPFLKETYGRAVEEAIQEEPGRNLRLVHRMQYAKYKEITENYREFKGKFEISFKYSQAHMYSGTKPVFFDHFIKENEGDLNQSIHYWMTLRDDDFYLFRWGNPSYAAEYIKNMPVSRMAGFYMGADGFTWGRDYTGSTNHEHPLYLKKMWYKFMIWGQLSYFPDLDSSYFKEELKCSYGEAGTELFAVWSKVSEIIPLVNQVHWHDYDFQWYPEGCCMFEHPPVSRLRFADILEFMECPSMPGSGYLSIKDYVWNESKSNISTLKTPELAAQKLLFTGKETQSKLTLLLKAAGGGKNTEYTLLLKDLMAMSYLGQYYGLKIKAAIELERLKAEPENMVHGQSALQYLKNAAATWKKYSSAAGKLYQPQRFARLCSYVDFAMFNRPAELDIKLAEEEISRQQHSSSQP